PPAGEGMAERYRDIAAANFTLVIGGFGARTPESVREQLRLCEANDLRAVVSRAGLKAEELPESPACWGYMLRDEPNAADFAALRRDVDAIRAARPGRLVYINLFPNYANTKQLGTETYEEHVRRFVDEVGTDVLSMDHYPRMQPKADGRAAYCANLDVLRVHALRTGVPFWNFFNTMPFGPHYDPTEHSIRWQVFTSLAHGAKGVLYFCYWTPRGAEFPRGGAIITAEGRKTRHYGQAQRLNAAVKALGPTLMQLTSEGVVRVSASTSTPEALRNTPLTALAGPPEAEYLLGLFRHADGRRALLLCNYDYLFTSWPTVEFGAHPDQVREVSQATGAEIPLLDDSPDMPGLQLSLDAGAGRLFLLPD
ncbi:MAG: beta-galactosidase, partial [Lentisphaeria bacterium]|nr:beta-galactosidase [Lentisphaeria bacterium]